MLYHRTTATLFVFSPLLFVTSFPQSAFASTHTASDEWIQDYSACTYPCNQNSGLSYCGAQIASFHNEWARVGNNFIHEYNNRDVWAIDFIEDTDFGGGDQYATDSSFAYVYSGHGGGGNNAWGQTYTVPTCEPGYANYSCNVDIETARWGEYFGRYTVPNAGALSWALLMTCFSVDVSPDQQWNQTMWYGLDVVMGFRGLSSDSTLTTGDAGNWVDDTWGLNHYYTFKSAWLDHGDADWITGGDSPAILAAGVGLADAAWRRDSESQSIQTRRAVNNTTSADSFAWTWAD